MILPTLFSGAAWRTQRAADANKTVAVDAGDYVRSLLLRGAAAKRQSDVC